MSEIVYFDKFKEIKKLNEGDKLSIDVMDSPIYIVLHSLMEEIKNDIYKNERRKIIKEYLSNVLLTLLCIYTLLALAKMFYETRGF